MIAIQLSLLSIQAVLLRAEVKIVVGRKFKLISTAQWSLVLSLLSIQAVVTGESREKVVFFDSIRTIGLSRGLF